MDEKTLLLTFDVEEFDLPRDLSGSIPEADAYTLAHEGATRLLDLCEERGLRVTCFVTGSFGERFPETIGALARVGCEIACHGPTHAGLNGRGPEAEHVERLSAARRGLELIAGRPVIGYRSPRFEPVRREVLERAGFAYDSSVHPTWVPGRYNNLARNRAPERKGGIVEVPVSVTPVFRLPLSWIWFRNYPDFLVRLLARWSLAADGLLCLYFHGWELADLERVRRRYNLPRAVTRATGAALAGRLSGWLDSLRARGVRLDTMGGYVAYRFGAAGRTEAV